MSTEIIDEKIEVISIKPEIEDYIAVSYDEIKQQARMARKNKPRRKISSHTYIFPQDKFKEEHNNTNQYNKDLKWMYESLEKTYKCLERRYGKQER